MHWYSFIKHSVEAGTRSRGSPSCPERARNSSRPVFTPGKSCTTSRGKVESSTVSKRVGRESRRTELVISTDQGRRDGGAFVMAQYERGRVSFQMMADVARERGSINRNTNQFNTSYFISAQLQRNRQVDGVRPSMIRRRLDQNFVLGDPEYHPSPCQPLLRPARPFL
jgi:hypothetical protein